MKLTTAERSWVDREILNEGITTLWIDPMRDTHSPNNPNGTHFEVCSELEATHWSIIGTHPSGDGYYLADCLTRAGAETLAAELAAQHKLDRGK